MNEHFDPKHQENSTPNKDGQTSFRQDTQPRVWNVPPQDGKEYHAPYTQQYSSSGWKGTDSNFAPSRQEPPYKWNFSELEQASAAKRKKRKGLSVFAIILSSVAAVCLVAFAGVGIYSTFSGGLNADNAQEPTLQIPAGDLPSITLRDKPETEEHPLASGKLSTEEIVERVEPSIVAITTYVNYQDYQASGMGSGIVIREDGYIVTNAHVVEGAVGITVQMNDGTQYEGRIIGLDSKTDLAVIKVDANGLKAAEFGNSEQTRVGEKVIAIGNPQSMEFYGSVTQGIVSGLNRSLTAGKTNYSSLIQTDAAINPGNSGGALVNEYGQIIGINSAKVVTTGAEGMGFAIPASTVKPIVDDLIQYGRVTGRVRLGITATAVDEVLARLNNVPTGLFVQSTDPESDISKKGVIPGDIITKINDVSIDSFQSLSEQLEGKKPGDTVKLEVYRPAQRRGSSGKFFEIQIKLLEDMGNTAATDSPQKQPPIQETPLPNIENFEDFFNRFLR